MNALRNKHLVRCCSQWLTVTRHLSSQRQNTEASKVVLEPLVQRTLIRVSGPDVIPFLQGLTTNDMKILESPSVPCIYTMFLNKAGRVMFDAIVYSANDPSTVLIECDRDVSIELRRHLKIYLVRRKIQIDDVADEMKPWVLFTKIKEDGTIPSVKSVRDVKVFPDPRLSDLGYRLLAPSALTNSDLSTLLMDGDKFVVASASDDLSYRDHRYGLGVAEGVVDLLPGKQFPLEANCDILNGVSFNKGCYIGQELTARVHHTGVIRKRHMPIQLSDSLPNDSTKIVRTEDGTKVGTVLGNTAKRAVCLLRVEKVLKCKEMFIDGKTCYTEKPLWWPPEVISNVAKRNSV